MNRPMARYGLMSRRHRTAPLGGGHGGGRYQTAADGVGMTALSVRMPLVTAHRNNRQTVRLFVCISFFRSFPLCFTDLFYMSLFICFFFCIPSLFFSPSLHPFSLSLSPFTLPLPLPLSSSPLSVSLSPLTLTLIADNIVLCRRHVPVRYLSGRRRISPSHRSFRVYQRVVCQSRRQRCPLPSAAVIR